MKSPHGRKSQVRNPSSALGGEDIDSVYGLEPIFEPGNDPGQEHEQAAVFRSIQCPYCGERFDTQVDIGNGAARYIEDCQICCQPIEFEPEVDPRGVIIGLGVHRS